MAVTFPKLLILIQSYSCESEAGTQRREIWDTGSIELCGESYLSIKQLREVFSVVRNFKGGA